MDDHCDCGFADDMFANNCCEACSNLIDVGTCQTCGGYGKTGTTCGRTEACREYGSEHM